jgi:hypothetical protein
VCCHSIIDYYLIIALINLPLGIVAAIVGSSITLVNEMPTKIMSELNFKILFQYFASLFQMCNVDLMDTDRDTTHDIYGDIDNNLKMT